MNQQNHNTFDKVIIVLQVAQNCFCHFYLYDRPLVHSNANIANFSTSHQPKVVKNCFVQYLLERDTTYLPVGN